VIRDTGLIRLILIHGGGRLGHAQRAEKDGLKDARHSSSDLF
jgi:isopentenyl phosphate kinase